MNTKNKFFKLANDRGLHFFRLVLALLTVATPSITGFAQTFTCDSQLYQVVNGTDLKVLIPSTGEYQTIGSSSTSYNGAGFNAEDGYIYGIGSGTKLLRIDNTGAATDLGAISNFTALSYSGDFDTSGNWYSFSKSGSTWIMNKIDVSELPAVVQSSNPTELSGVGNASKTNDIAYNAVTNKFYGMTGGKVIEYDHINNTVQNIADYSDQADSGGYGAVWSDQTGNTYFFNNGTGNIYRAVFQANGTISSFAFIATSSPNGNNDGMSCALAAPPVFPEICDNGIDDDGDGLVDCNDPDCTSKESCGITGSIESSAFGCQQSIVTYHLFLTNNSTIANTVIVNEVLPQGFTFFQDSISFDAGGYSDFNQQPVSGDQGAIAWGNIYLEGGETVKISYDVTLDNTIVYGNQSNSISMSLSQAGTAAYPSTLSSSILLADCPTPKTYTCEPAFYQVYKKKGKKQPNVYGKLNPETGDYDQIAIASDRANGLGYDINTGLVYGATGKKFIQLDEDGVVLDQGITFTKNVFRGDINESSEWYGVDGSDMVKIDVSGSPTVVATYTGQGLSGWDIAYNKDGNFYSVHNQTLYQFNTTTNTTSTVGTITGSGLPSSGGYGAQWTGSDGYLYASHNSTGSILRVDVSSLEARIVSLSIDGLSLNDGFSCPTEIPAVYEFDYGDNSALPLSRILSYRQDVNEDDLPDFHSAWLGNTINSESSDPSNVDADGDLDDGFTLSTEIEGNELSSVIALNANKEDWVYYLLGFDWDDDGAFDEVTVDSTYLTVPETMIKSVTVPQGFTDGAVNVRVIVAESLLTTAQISGDIVELGEVEDYRFNLTTTCEGEDCQVSTGSNGGLESDGSLATAIAKRSYTRVKNNDKVHLKAFQQTLVEFRRSTPQRNREMDVYFPSTGNTGEEDATVTSPKDLVALTNAIDVFALDYYLQERRVAASLLLSTKDKAYNHSKNVCDRLNGKSVEDAQVFNLDGIRLILAKIKNINGTSEYSAWFSAKETDDGYEVFSLWNVDGYPEGDYLNFQAWGASPGQVFHILKHALKQLRKEKKVKTAANLESLPKVIVKSGKYENGILKLTILNKSKVSEVELTANMRKTEDHALINKVYPISLSGSIEEEVTVETGYIFDAGISIQTENSTNYDALYLADGAWGTDYNTSVSQVNEFSITAVNEAPNANEYLVERNFRISGASSDVVNVFRNLKAGEGSLQCSGYSTLSLEIENDQPIEIVLVENNLSDWNNRLKYTVAANNSGNRRIIKLSDFTGQKTTENLDLKSIVFSYINSTGSTDSFHVAISNIVFGNEVILGTDESIAESQGMSVYPNPVKEQGTIAFTSEKAGGFLLSIADVTGKIVHMERGKVSSGLQHLTFSHDNLLPGLYLISLELPSGKTLTNKVFFE